MIAPPPAPSAPPVKARLPAVLPHPANVVSDAASTTQILSLRNMTIHPNIF
jgi:hypothetical protein